MGWNDFVYGQQSGSGCGCGGQNIGGNYNNNSNYNTSNFSNRCDGRDLLRGISKNDFIKVFLKSSRPVSGFFAGVSRNVLTLFNCEKRRVSTIDICLEDIVAIKSFGERFDDDRHDDHHDDCGCD
ncbi:hypothetical protein [Sporolactobacillus laevolacticus]|jgi:hypothetical protein|uniref:Uncharacterized protein n=1 Tax=Sporolactobacillus laevolacticus DSM 442 TaxID=1395513 RepID=V6IU37_9BACL|nr:hypothetical protein [Sporolactobacillus laevolacticus]EST10528.1 hypothetical protein P343_16520 [Sporolactobacillus laevolacticus DSM 442]MDF2910913.1 hypothetical protein [Sporolactobacillus laevolacticus]MDN3953728.1 hypothetical protein [Sporolactobacillus laevolacticus]